MNNPTTKQQVVGRFAPTPSGRMHAGNLFSALMAWLSVRSSGGRLVLRIEDLDPRAQDRHTAQVLMDDLEWLGLTWDEGPYYQSERGDIYLDALGRLRQEGLTYPCFCTRAELHAATAPHASDGTYIYQGTCRNLTPEEVAERLKRRPPATRLRVPMPADPHSSYSFVDKVYGLQSEVLASECGDFLVQRSDGVIAYQLAVVVDDGLMGVTEVVRGHDLLGSSARQMYLQDLLGFPHPAYAHVPLLIAPDGRRLSKRDADLDLGALKERFRRPEAIIGRLASLVGMAEPGEEVSADRLVGRFSWEAVAAHRGDIVASEGFLTK